MSWNIGGFVARLKEQGFVDYVTKFDIFCLLETFVDKITYLEEIFPAYDSFIAPAHKIGLGRMSGGVIVLVKKTFKKYFKFIDMGLPNLICGKLSKSLLSTDHDIVIIFTYVHPQNSKWYDTAETSCDISNIDVCISDLLKKYKDVHFIVCGDLNSRIGDLSPRTEIDDNIPWLDEESEQDRRRSEDNTVNTFGKTLLALCEVFELVVLNGYCNGDREGKFTYITQGGSSVIDYFLCSYNFLSMNLKLIVGEELLSQHLPLEMYISKNELVLTHIDTKYKEVSRIAWDEEKKNLLEKAAQSPEGTELYNKAMQLISVDLDKALDVFTDFLRCVSKCMMKISRSSKQSNKVSWFDQECKDKKFETRRLLRHYRKSRNEEDRQTYCLNRKEYKHLLKFKREQFKRKQVDSLIYASKDNIRFWNTVRSLLRKSQPKANIPLQQWQLYFEDLLNDVEYKGIKITEDLQTFPTDYCHITDRPITIEEINEAIRHLKRNKSPGWDGIPAEIVKNINATSFLLDYLNALFSTGYFPKFWCKSVIVPLLKKGDIENPNNYRGVSLLSVVSKIFTYILNKRLTLWMEDCKLLAEEQAGFRTGRSTVDHIFTLFTIIQKSMAQHKGKLYVAFVDYQKAFDSVIRENLWNCLYKKGLSTKMLRVIKSMYENVLCCVKVGQDYTEFFESPTGVKQGCL